MAESIVNIYACNKATKISRQSMNNANGTAITTPAHFIMNIKPINDKIIIVPAVIFANNLISSANGFVNNPINSTTIIIGKTNTGTPCGTSPLKYPKNPFFFIPIIWVVKKVISASPVVTLMFLVGCAMKGTSPIKFANKIKKKIVRKNGSSLSPSFPILGNTISSRMKTIITSIKLPIPFGTLFFVLIDTALISTKIKITDESIIINKLFVTEKSIVNPPMCTGGNFGSGSFPKK